MKPPSELLKTLHGSNESIIDALSHLGEMQAGDAPGSEEQMVILKRTHPSTDVRQSAEFSLQQRRNRNKGKQGYNKHGIPRKIPAYVSRQVRKQSGYGCVICRDTPCDYDHFDPQFSELMEEHTADGIALLCDRHHRRKGSTLSDWQIKNACELGRKNGWARSTFDADLDPELGLVLEIGNLQFIDAYKLVVEDEIAFWIRYDAVHGFLIDANLHDAGGHLLCAIRENAFEYIVDAHMDFEVTANRLKWSNRKQTILELTISPPPDLNSRHSIEINKLDMLLRGHRFWIDNEGRYHQGETDLPLLLSGQNISLTNVTCHINANGYDVSVGTFESGNIEVIDSLIVGRFAPTTIEDRTFVGDGQHSVRLDGIKYIRCNFHGCQLLLEGYPLDLEDCSIRSCIQCFLPNSVRLLRSLRGKIPAEVLHSAAVFATAKGFISDELGPNDHYRLSNLLDSMHLLRPYVDFSPIVNHTLR